MQTRMSLQMVLFAFLRILLQSTPSCFPFLLHHSSVVVQAADVTTGTPLFMGLNVLWGNGHTVSTELETLLYVLIFTLAASCLGVTWTVRTHF